MMIALNHLFIIWSTELLLREETMYLTYILAILFIFVGFVLLLSLYFWMQSRYVVAHIHTFQFKTVGLLTVVSLVLIHELDALSHFMKKLPAYIEIQEQESIKWVDILLNGGVGIVLALVLFSYIQYKYYTARHTV